MTGQQWQDTARRPELTEGKAPRTALGTPSRRPPAIAHQQSMRWTSCRTSPQPPPEPIVPPQVHPRGGQLFGQDPHHLHKQTPTSWHPPPLVPGSAPSVMQVCLRSLGTCVVETKTRRNEETRREPGVHRQAFFFFFKLTSNRCNMFRSAKAEVSSNSLSASVAGGHASSASPSTRILHLHARSRSLQTWWVNHLVTSSGKETTCRAL
jgi:hypothetical protein